MVRCGSERTGRARAWLALGALCLGIGCAGGAAAPVSNAADGRGPTVDAAPPRYPILVGVAYAFLQREGEAARVARLLAPTGAHAAKPYCAHIAWGRMQPRVGGPIDFSALDRFVEGYQGAGFEELMICLESRNPWATRSRPATLRSKSPAPAAEHVAAYERWVGAIVERYDGDGVADLPGLRHPVRFYQVGSELARFGEPPEEYLVMLEHAYRAAHAASHDVVVAHAAFLAADAFRGADHAARVPAPLAEQTESREAAELAVVLDRPDLFDALNVQALGDPTEIEAVVTWLQHETSRRGYWKPILVSDAATSPLVAWGPATRCEGSPQELGRVVFPVTEDDRCRVAEYFQRLVDGDPEVLAWTRAFAAADLQKKVVIAAERGALLINTALIEDVEWWKRPSLKAAAGAAPWGGLLDVRSGEQRPAFHALSQLMRHLRDRDRIRRLRDLPPGARVYALDGPAGPLWIAWFDAGQVVLPGEPEPAGIAFFSTGSSRVRVETALTHAASEEPPHTLVDTVEGVAWLELTPTPVFVEPVAD